MSDRDTAAFPWRRVIGCVVLILAVLYAGEHPHTFLYYVIKFIATP